MLPLATTTHPGIRQLVAFATSSHTEILQQFFKLHGLPVLFTVSLYNTL